MQCLRCRTDNPARARYCMECGVLLLSQCGQCGAVSATSDVCSECGFSLGAQADSSARADAFEPPQAERRQVTVLFCDLVGSTELTCMLGERYHEVLRAYVSDIEEVVRGLSGHVAQRLGDGLLVYFGYPEAHEDDARRAVAAGLAIMKAVRRLDHSIQQAHGVRIATRVGVGTGLVVAGPVGTGAGAERLALGLTPNLASRLKDVAEPGTVVISELTRRLVEGYFAVRDLGVSELKGVGRVRVYEVLQRGSARSRLDLAVRPGLTPFVGRESELQLFRERWARVKAEHRGHVLLLCGEAGIGKSRLIRAIEEIVAEEPDSWLTPCQASPYHRHTAFHPVIDLLERTVLDFQADDAHNERERKLEDWLLQYELNLEETLPVFRRLLSIESADAAPADPKLDRQRAMECIAQILVARASKQPVLFVLEDLHWADASTIELLDLLIARSCDARVLLVLTYRPEFQAQWANSEHVTRVTVDRLWRPDSEKIAMAVFGNSVLSDDVLNQILDRTDGNPLFIEELSKTVRDADLVDGGDWVATPRGRRQLEIPATLRDSLMARLDRLPGAKRVAPLCAALGREFSYELLAAVAPYDDAHLQPVVDELVEAGLLYRRSDSTQRVFVFKHALIQEIAYDLMVREARQTTHRRIAEALEQRFHEVATRQPELVAHHFLESAQPERAIPYWQLAGQHALQRAANVEAIAHLERALDVLTTTTPRGDARDARELELQHALAPAYMAIRGWASRDVERTCRRALELSGDAGDFGSLWGLWTNHFLRARLDDALETGHRVLQLADAAREKEGATASRQTTNLEVMARHAVGYSHFYRAEFVAARDDAQAGLRLRNIGPDAEFDIAAEREIVHYFQLSSSAALRIILGSSLWMLGFPDRATVFVDDAINLSRELQHHPSEAYALGTSLIVDHCCLDLDRTEAHAEQLRLLAQRERFELYGPIAMAFSGWVRSERGDASGLEMIRLGRDQFRATGSVLNQTILTALLARALRKVGRREEAISLLETEISAALDRHELHFTPELYRLSGEILIDTGHAAKGEDFLEQAYHLAHEQGARILEARSLVSIGTYSPRMDRRVSALDRLETVCQQFTEGFDAPDLVAARDTISRFGSAASQKRKSPPGSAMA
jgi:class 3 adenylate cyclase/tetratricopeptide (TPR) repeat protein